MKTFGIFVLLFGLGCSASTIDLINFGIVVDTVGQAANQSSLSDQWSIDAAISTATCQLTDRTWYTVITAPTSIQVAMLPPAEGIHFVVASQLFSYLGPTACVQNVVYVVDQITSTLFAVDVSVKPPTVANVSESGGGLANITLIDVTALQAVSTSLFVAQASAGIRMLDFSVGEAFWFVAPAVSVSSDGYAKGTLLIQPLPSATTMTPVAMSARNNAVYFVEGGSSQVIRRMTLTNPATITTIGGIRASTTAVDGPLSIGTFASASAIVSIATQSLVIVDGITLRLLDLAAGTISTFAGFFGTGVIDGLLLASLSGPVSQVAGFLNDYALVPDNHAGIVRMLLPTPLLSNFDSSALLQQFTVTPALRRTANNAIGFAVLPNLPWTIYVADTSANQVWIGTVLSGFSGALQLPVPCNFGGIAMGLDSTTNRPTVVLSCLHHSLYVVDTMSGNLGWWCGKQDYPGYVDAPCGTAKFSSPHGLSAAGPGVYVADSANNMIRLVSWTRVAQVVAGNGTQGRNDGPALRSTFSNPLAITTPPSFGNIIFVGEGTLSMTPGAIRKLDTQLGIVTTVFLGSWSTSVRDGTDGSVLSPTSIAACGDTILITDSGLLRRVVPSAVANRAAVVTLQNQAVKTALFVSRLPDMTTCSNFGLLDGVLGNISSIQLFDTQTNGTFVENDVMTSSSPQSSGDGTTASGLFVNVSELSAMAWCALTQLLLIAEGNQLRFLSPLRGTFSVPVDGTIGDVICDGSGTITFTVPDAHVVMRLNGTWDTSPSRTVFEVCGVTGMAGFSNPFLFSPTHLAGGNDYGTTAFVTEPDAHRILQLTTTNRRSVVLVGSLDFPGLLDGPWSNASLNAPGAMTFDSSRNELYFFDSGLLRRVRIDIQVVDTLLGKFGDRSGTDGLQGLASWTSPFALEISTLGDQIFVADSCRVRVVTWTIVGPRVDSISGPCNDSSRATPSFGNIRGLALTSDTSLLIADSRTSQIVKLRPQVLINEAHFAVVWGDTCNWNRIANRDSRRGYRGQLGTVAALTVGLQANVLYALETDGTTRGLYNEGAILTLRGASSSINDARGAVLSLTSEALIVANHGHNNIVRCPLVAGLDCSVVSGARAAPFLGGDTVGSGSTALWIGPAAISVVGNNYVVMETEGCRIRYLDVQFTATPFAGSRTTLCVSLDGPLNSALLLYPKALAVHPDGRIFFAELTCLRTIQGQIVSTVSGICDQASQFVVDGPFAPFSALSSLALTYTMDADWMYLVDSTAIRRIDLRDPFCITRTLVDNYQSENPASLVPRLLSVNGSRVFINDVNCSVSWLDPPEGQTFPTFDRYQYITPTQSGTLSSTGTTTLSESQTITVSETVTLIEPATLTSQLTASRSIRNVTASKTPSVVNPPFLILLPDTLSQADLASLGSTDAARTFTALLFGTLFDLSNITLLTDAYPFITFAALTQDLSTASFVKRQTSLFQPQSIVSLNASSIVITLIADASYFAYKAENVRVTILAPLLASRATAASGELILDKTPVASALQAQLQQYAIVTGNVGGALIGFVSMHSAAAAQASRAMLMIQLQVCDFLSSDPIPWYGYPVGAAIGSVATSYHRGAMLINPAILMGFVLCHLIVSDYLRYYTKKTRRNSMGIVWFPSLVIPGCMFLMQQSVASAIVVATRDPEIVWQALGGCTAFAWGVFGAAVLLFFSAFPSIFVEYESETGRRPSRLAFFFLGSGEWRDAPDSLSPYSTRMHYLLFGIYRPGCEWFLFLEIMVSVAEGWGSASIDSGNCFQASITATSAQSVLFVAVLLLRPYVTPFETLFYLVFDGAMLGAAVILTIPRVTPTPSDGVLISTGGEIANVALTALAGKAAVDVIIRFVNHFYGQALQTAKAQQDALEAVPPKGLLTGLWETQHRATATAHRSGESRDVDQFDTVAPLDWSQDDSSGHSDNDSFLNTALAQISERKAVAERFASSRKKRTTAKLRRKKVKPMNPLAETTPSSQPDFGRLYAML